MLPLFPLKTVLIPGGEVVLRVVEGRYRKLLEACLEGGCTFGVIFCSDYSDERGTLGQVGCIAHVVEHELLEDGSHRVLVRGGERFRALDVVEENNVLHTLSPEPVEDVIDLRPSDPLLRTSRSMAEVYSHLLGDADPGYTPHSLPNVLRPMDSFALIRHLMLPEEAKQKALEVRSVKERFDMGLGHLKREIETLRFLMVDPAIEEMRVLH